MTDKTKDKDPKMSKSRQARSIGIKDVERYKKWVQSSVTSLMIISMAFCLIILIYHWVYLQVGGRFYIARTRQDYMKEVDFEQVQASDIFYFLVRNESDYAKDADESNMQDIVNDPLESCGGSKEINEYKVQLLEDIEKAR